MPAAYHHALTGILSYRHTAMMRAGTLTVNEILCRDFKICDGCVMYVDRCQKKAPACQFSSLNSSDSDSSISHSFCSCSHDPLIPLLTSLCTAKSKLLRCLLDTDWHPLSNLHVRNVTVGQVDIWQNQSGTLECIRVFTNFQSILSSRHAPPGSQNGYFLLLPFLATTMQIPPWLPL